MRCPQRVKHFLGAVQKETASFAQSSPQSNLYSSNPADINQIDFHISLQNQHLCLPAPPPEPHER